MRICTYGNRTVHNRIRIRLHAVLSPFGNVAAIHDDAAAIHLCHKPLLCASIPLSKYVLPTLRARNIFGFPCLGSLCTACNRFIWIAFLRSPGPDQFTELV